MNTMNAETFENKEIIAERNLKRAMMLLDTGITKFFSGDDMRMADVYDVRTHRTEGTADVWPYTAVIESVNSVLEALERIKDARWDIYKTNRAR